MTVPEYRGLSKVEPEKRLTKKVHSPAGRNNTGRITVRHQGGHVKRSYRIVDFRQSDKVGVSARVETLEYDPYRTAFIMKLLYRDGSRRYAIAPQGVAVGDELLNSAEAAPFKPGNRMPLRHIPVGYIVHNVELNPGKGGQIIRSAGSAGEILAHDDGYTHLKLPSGEVRRILWGNGASLGQVSNADWGLTTIGKAGRSRHRGIRPTVRGTAMNPVDHPYGGGEGRQPRGTRKPKTLWGKVTGGRKTRDPKKWSKTVIVSRRTKKGRKK